MGNEFPFGVLQVENLQAGADQPAVQNATLIGKVKKIPVVIEQNNLR